MYMSFDLFNFLYTRNVQSFSGLRWRPIDHLWRLCDASQKWWMELWKKSPGIKILERISSLQTKGHRWRIYHLKKRKTDSFLLFLFPKSYKRENESYVFLIKKIKCAIRSISCLKLSWFNDNILSIQMSVCCHCSRTFWSNHCCSSCIQVCCSCFCSSCIQGSCSCRI